MFGIYGILDITQRITVIGRGLSFHDLWLDSSFSVSPSYSSSKHQVYDLTLTRLRTQPCTTGLVNNCRVCSKYIFSNHKVFILHFYFGCSIKYLKSNTGISNLSIYFWFKKFWKLFCQVLLIHFIPIQMHDFDKKCHHPAVVAWFVSTSTVDQIPAREDNLYGSGHTHILWRMEVGVSRPAKV